MHKNHMYCSAQVPSKCQGTVAQFCSWYLLLNILEYSLCDWHAYDFYLDSKYHQQNLCAMGRKPACLLEAAPPPPTAKIMPQDSGAKPQAPRQCQAD